MRNGANRAEPKNRRPDSPLPKRIINVPILKFKRKCKSDTNLSKKRNGSFSSALYPARDGAGPDLRYRAGREARLPVRAAARACGNRSRWSLAVAFVERRSGVSREASLRRRRKAAPIGGGRLNQDTATHAKAAATRPVRATARAARRGSLFALPRGRAVTAPVGRLRNRRFISRKAHMPPQRVGPGPRPTTWGAQPEETSGSRREAAQKGIRRRENNK